METISVIIPVYNKEAYMERCLKSILNQSYANIEIIVIDDGSTDHSLQICMDYQEEDARITVISKSHNGLSSARNVGIDRANGTYLTFIDSDDFVAPDYIKLLYELITKYHADIAMTHFVMGCDDHYDFKDTTGKVSAYSNTEFIEKILIRGDSQSSCCKLYKMSIFHEIRFPEGMNWEDLAISAEIFYAAKSIVVMEHPLYYYFQNPKGIIHSKFDEKKLDAITAFEKRLDFLKHHNLPKAYKRFMRQYIAVLFQYYYLTKYYLPAEKAVHENIYSKIHNSYEKIKTYKDISFMLKLMARVGLAFPYLAGKALDYFI